MPFIRTEEVKQIRDALKKALPEFKLSVTKQHHSGVTVAIMKGPVDFGTDYEQVNHYYYKSHYEDKPEAIKVFDTILKTIDSCKQQKELVYDGDYGSIPNYYKNIHVGKWNKNYELTK